MADSWERYLDRWVRASLIDAETADRVRAFESEQEPAQGLKWPTIVALALGALLLSAGVLLFVSAHWDELSPTARMVLVSLLVLIFHVGGALTADRFRALAIALHAIGTATLGAGIALTGQIFHLDTHWPAGVLLWAIGAAVAWALLNHWTQAAALAVLAPYWLAGEWWVATETNLFSLRDPVVAGILLLTLTYLTSYRSEADSDIRFALAWIGGVALLPAAIIFGTAGHEPVMYPQLGWSLWIGTPLALAWALRRREAWMNGVGAGWIVVAYLLQSDGPKLMVHAWHAAGALGLVAWGLRERRAALINLGIAGFTITVGVFYFSNVMDKLGRSASLMLLGLLFLGGGWAIEKWRRQLIARIRPEAV